jgi:hypothetical protein
MKNLESEDHDEGRTLAFRWVLSKIGCENGMKYLSDDILWY